MKKFLLLAAFLILSAVPHALAQSSGTFVPLSPIPGLTDLQPETGGLATFFNNLYKYLIGLSAALAVIMIIWGGLEYSTQDSVSKKESGKERIKQAIFGLVLVLSPVLVFSIINPSILNLSVNFQKLDTTVNSPEPTTSPATICDPRANTNNAACREQAINQCRTSGGTPIDTLVNGVPTITCQTTGPLAPGATMTIDQCTGQPTNDQGIVTPTQHTCSTLTATERGHAQNCRDLTPSGTGVCLW